MNHDEERAERERNAVRAFDDLVYVLTLFTPQVKHLIAERSKATIFNCRQMSMALSRALVVWRQAEDEVNAPGCTEHHRRMVRNKRSGGAVDEEDRNSITDKIEKLRKLGQRYEDCEPIGRPPEDYGKTTENT